MTIYKTINANTKQDLVNSLREDMEEIKAKITETNISSIIKEFNESHQGFTKSFLTEVQIEDYDSTEDGGWYQAISMIVPLDLNYVDQYFKEVMEIKYDFIRVCEELIKHFESESDTLWSIWSDQNNRNHYDEVIKTLKKNFPKIEGPFLITVDGKDKWRKFGNNISYLLGLTEYLQTENYIIPQKKKFYKKIYINSFDLDESTALSSFTKLGSMSKYTGIFKNSLPKP